MDFLEFKSKTAKWNQLSGVDVLGSYDFYTSIISLDSLEKPDIDKLKTLFIKSPTILAAGGKTNPAQYESLQKVFPLAAHEYTHFVDATSTLWGLRHLSKMNLAYLSNNKIGGTESEFHFAKKFHDHVRKIRLPQYYTLIQQDTPRTNRWQSRITIGRIFSKEGLISDRSVLFSWFTSETGTPLARSPISTVSILEASAMAQEVIFATSLINTTPDDFKVVEAANFSRKMANYIYNHNITEYSVCVHLVANRTKCQDIFVSFTICAILTRLTLNFPDRAFDEVAENCSIEDILEIPTGHEFGRAMRDGIKNRDLGAVFYLLCSALPTDSAASPKHTKDGIEQALREIGLKTDSMQEWKIKEANELASQITESNIEPLSLLAKSGIKNIKSIKDDSFSIPFNLLDLPPALLGDSSTWLPFTSPNNNLANFDLDLCFDELFNGQEWVERFSEACV